MDMADIPHTFREVDLLSSEGAACNIEFPQALRKWRFSMKSGGFAVASELLWLLDETPAEVRQLLQACYPDMQSTNENQAVDQDADYVLSTHKLPRETWVERYCDILELREKAMLDHPDESVSGFATETIEEITNLWML